MALMAKGKKVIAVEENASEMRVSPLDLPKHLRTRIIRAHSYAEAAGLVVALREGIWLPSLSSAVSPLQSHG